MFTFIVLFVLLLLALSPLIIGFLSVKLTERERPVDYSSNYIAVDDEDTKGITDVRGLIYIVFGVIPISTIWIVFGLFIFEEQPVISLFVLLAIVGMYIATFSKRTSMIFCLKICCLLTVVQALTAVIGLNYDFNSTDSLVNLIFIYSVGPACVSIHYQMDFCYQFFIKKLLLQPSNSSNI